MDAIESVYEEAVSYATNLATAAIAGAIGGLPGAAAAVLATVFQDVVMQDIEAGIIVDITEVPPEELGNVVSMSHVETTLATSEQTVDDVTDSCGSDRDGDGVGDACDSCPNDAQKVGPGDCGCGEPETCNEPGPTPSGETLTLNLGSGVTMELVRIPHGTFLMGSEGFALGYAPSEIPVHSVTLTQDFYIGRYEVTQAQWEAVMRDNPSHYTGCDMCPVEEVSWYNAVEFCDVLSSVTGYSVRLPSEAEWEYVARAGTATQYWFGDSFGDLGNHAWYSPNSGSETHEVGGKQPNPWGLYDTYGNVWEWCSDWWGDYSDSPSSDPLGPGSGEGKVLRGGGYHNTSLDLRSPGRAGRFPYRHVRDAGFRVAAGT